VPRSIRTLILLAGLSFFLGLGWPAITDSDEGFYAEASREMVESGDWLTPHFNYTDRWQKPVLYYWLTAATYTVAGVAEWSARLWSALSGLGLVLLTFAAARELTQREEDAWLAAAITATSYGYFALARAALPDLPLAFFITLGIWMALRERWLLAGLAAGLGFLTKGPIALVIPGLVLLPIWWRERRTVHLRPRNFVVAAIVFAAVGLPWYVAMVQAHGAAYLQSFFLSDNFERFATDRYNDPRPFWFYLPIVIGGLFPWSAFLVVLPWRSARDVWRWTRRLTDAEWRLLLWIVLPLIFFTLSIGKQPRYILPVLPPLAMLLGRSIANRIRAAATSPAAARELSIASWLTVALFGAGALLLWRSRALFIGALPVLTTAGTIAVLGAIVAVAAVAAFRWWRALPMTMAAASVAILLAAQFGAMAGRRPEPVEQMASLIARYRVGGEPVGEYQTFVRNLVFYTGFRHEELYDEDRAVAFLKSDGPVLLVVAERDLPRLEQRAGLTTTTLDAVDYLNTANIRLGTLLNPSPAQEIERVLLVTNR
jgi:4-amino-4-deoxy-L-arabinose transferase-like glycosyltransferase